MGGASESSPLSFVSPTIPMISRVGSSNSGPSPLPNTMRWPIASAPGKYFFAKVPLTITTGAVPGASRSRKARPRRSGIPSTRKYSGVIDRQLSSP
jgi:hypothetical protein